LAIEIHPHSTQTTDLSISLIGFDAFFASITPTYSIHVVAHDFKICLPRATRMGF
jgi:hypothetical protein